MKDARILEVQTKLVQIISPHMGKWLAVQADTRECAINTLTAIQNTGVSYQELFTAFPNPAVLMDIAHRLGVPKMGDPWLNKYYADLRNHAAHESRRATQG